MEMEYLEGVVARGDLARVDGHACHERSVIEVEVDLDVMKCDRFRKALHIGRIRRQK